MSQSAPASARKLELYTRISIYGVLALQPLVYLNAFPSSVPALGGLIGFVQAVLSIMVCSRAMTALHDQRRRPTPTEWRALGPWLTFSAGVLIVMIGQLQPGQVWIPTVAVAVAVPVGVIALLLPALTGLALGLSLGTVAGLLAGWRTQAPMETLLPLGILSGAIVALFALSFWLTGWMLRNIWELEEARRAAAQLAIAQERLRISRDLHDLFGRTMATVAVKTELAGELVRRGRSEAALTQLSEVRSIAEQTGQQVRAVVQGYRPDDLATELAGARSLLDSAGIRCVVRGSAPAGLQPEVVSGLAWVLREAVTNVIRHSRATECIISLENPDRLHLTITNDGAEPSDDGRHATSGHGLIGMRERMTDLHGELTIRHEQGRFTIEASVPQP